MFSVSKAAVQMCALAALDEMPPLLKPKCRPCFGARVGDRYEQVTPGYHMNKKHWNMFGIAGGIHPSC